MSNKLLIPYLTYGYPSLKFTEACVTTCFDNGADFVELGIPFSDPLADGPVIQKTHQDALATGEDVSLSSALKFVDVFNKKYPSRRILFMASINLIIQYGEKRFFEDAHKVGLSGIVIPDLSIEEAPPYLELSETYHVSLILLISPLCSERRMKLIAKHASTFLYLISTTGLTGERAQVSEHLPDFVAQLRKETDVPICVGFGISQPDHVDYISSFADGAIIGSHFKKIIIEHGDQLPQALQLISERVSLFRSHLG